MTTKEYWNLLIVKYSLTEEEQDLIKELTNYAQKEMQTEIYSKIDLINEKNIRREVLMVNTLAILLFVENEIYKEFVGS